MNLYQYHCKDCGYKREGLLDHPAIGIGSYSTICPECGGQYDSYVSDGPAMVSTGLDIEDGNTVGDDCKSSKISKCKNIYFQVHASER